LEGKISLISDNERANKESGFGGGIPSHGVESYEGWFAPSIRRSFNGVISRWWVGASFCFDRTENNAVAGKARTSHPEGDEARAPVVNHRFESQPYPRG